LLFLGKNHPYAFFRPTDTVVAQLTAEARSILARVKTGDVVYKHLGWQLGRGGYQDEFTSAKAAKQTLEVVDFPAAGNTVNIGGAVITALLSGANGTTQFDIGATLEDTAENLKAAININSILGQYFLATREGTIITVECRVKGGIGNFIALSAEGSWLDLGGPRLSGGLGQSGPIRLKCSRLRITQPKPKPWCKSPDWTSSQETRLLSTASSLRSTSIGCLRKRKK
jgi:hypothetical protein